ncbi:SIMPL domain-containing protein [Oryzobacter telluris]|jgi:uncharacterized protein YggE|uniref:SIMPL domain-containing protein n=1 Tax=Oryzobacter telluris TaxID=3149179 RepID=UPI00370D5F17
MSDHVEVTGSGAASAVPDVVVLDTRVQAEAPDVATALAQAASRVAAALQAAADHGIADRDRRTRGMGVNPRWDREGQRVVGYTAHHAVRLVVRDRDRVGDVIGAMAGAAGDAFGLDAVTLEVADPAPLLVRAREAAFEDARSRAEQYASLADRPLGPVLRVTEGGGFEPPTPRFAKAAMDVGGGMPVEAGESTVTATVTVRFGLA